MVFYKLVLTMWTCKLNTRPLRYHIVEEFNRGIYDYLIASDESELKGEQDSDVEDEGEDEANEEEPKKEDKKGIYVCSGATLF